MCSRFFYCHSGGGYLSLYFLAERQEIKDRQSTLQQASDSEAMNRFDQLSDYSIFAVDRETCTLQCFST